MSIPVTQPSANQPTGQYVQVLADCPGLEDLLTYEIPPNLAIQAGDLLNVPLGNRIVSAIAVQITNQFTPAYTPKPVAALVSPSLLPPWYWQFLERTANYYRTPLVQTLKVALPPGLLTNSHYRLRLAQPGAMPKLSSAAQAVWQFLQQHPGISRRYLVQKLPQQGNPGLRQLQAQGLVHLELAPPAPPPQPKFQDWLVLQPSSLPLSDRQQQLVNLLEQMGGECEKSTFLKTAKSTSTTLKHLVAQGHVAIAARPQRRQTALSASPDQPQILTPDQAQALAAIQGLQPPHLQLLLHGVTGSGKTEVYLQAIAPILAQGQSVLVLVPEIGLTPQLTQRFYARFSQYPISLYHSRLANGERFDTWRAMLSPSPQILIGTRSAIFAPLANLGMIVLDEEHDSSFKQEQPQPCYHTRTLAQWRSQHHQCPLILGSATPAAETLHQAQQQTIAYATLPQRISNQPLPQVKVVDMRLELAERNFSILSRPLQQAIARAAEHKQQGILFIHRRGHSTFISCRSCGYVATCPHCDISLTFHLSANRLQCHYCGFTQANLSICPSCSSSAIKHFGSGSQKLEQEINRLFPHLKTLRFDSDTTRNQDQQQQILTAFHQGEADLLIGTQMLTKGLDIAQVTLVGVVAADGLLNFADFRASERALQILIQVAGRAGRGAEPGTVIIQTYSPEHPVIEAVQQYAYESFIATELSDRQILQYPPFGQLALIRLSSPKADLVERTAQDLAQALSQLHADWQVLGPAPALIPKVADRYRWQILLKFAPEQFQHLPSLAELKTLAPSVRLSLDVDPLQIF
ncbi:MAG: primosomal protein N' [Pseudanabaenaceae cyanobacterium bins.68]|nr:primosomal protein N' [Pseudanabaenaceae cyanobacterium bins.68]